MIDLARFGDRAAIEAADGHVTTYAELAALARRHASTSLVELPAERSVDFLARCLGAWLGGGAFRPFDPCDPRPRLPIAMVDGLAYVIATSGSTGAPKHVMVHRRGVPALWQTQVDAFALGPGARVLWLHAPLFDASISDWGTALSAGATLVLPTSRAVTQISEELAARAITHVDLPPSLLGQLDPPSCLRVVVLGGEACDAGRVRALAARVRVVVVYGPTEATVCSSLVVVDPARWSRPRIGHPLPGITYRVLDGELHIGGDALALGYAHDPGETARRFVDVGGTRMYRTGDRVEETPDGLAFLGRVDRQCKLRGRRVELGEIESALRRFVDDAAVLVKDDRVVAFVTGPVERAALAALLPRWMMPARFVVGPLPRTATGKVDRGALVVPPPVVRDPIARAWCDALGVDSVRDDDRFSEVGGDSLARLMLKVAFDALAADTIARGAGDTHAPGAGDLHALGAPVSAIDLTDVLDGDPTFGELVARTRTTRLRRPITVGECEARGLAILGAQPRPSSTRSSTTCASGALLITGANGQLGRALVRAWREHEPGRYIIALVRDARAVDARAVAARARARKIPAGLAGQPHTPHASLSEWGSGCSRAEVGVLRPELDAVAELDVDARGDLDVDELVYGDIREDSWHAGVRDRISAIVHCAATIQLGGGWDAHVETNVRGTAQIARLAGDDIAWHHISTLSVFVNTDRARGMHRTTDNPAADAIAYGGYAQTKIAAEAIARACGASIYRLGLLVGSAHDQRAMTLRALAKLGAVPAGFRDHDYDETPVAYAAAQIVAMAHAAPSTFHIAAGATRFGDVIDRMRLVELPHAVWLERARARLADPDIAMAIGAVSGRPELDLFLATGAEFR